MIDLEAIKARCEAATPGPWEPGDVWLWAGVMPAMFGKGRCSLCDRCGPPVWSGQRDINGKIMAAHKHRNPEPWSCDHHISGPEGTVAGNYDYEAGGILNADDLAFICAARTDVPALVAEVERLRGELARLKSTPVAGFCVCAPIPKLRVGQFLIACETCGRMRYVDSTPTTSSKRFRVDL